MADIKYTLANETFYVFPVTADAYGDKEDQVFLTHLCKEDEKSPSGAVPVCRRVKAKNILADYAWADGDPDVTFDDQGRVKVTCPYCNERLNRLKKAASKASKK